MIHPAWEPGCGLESNQCDYERHRKTTTGAETRIAPAPEADSSGLGKPYLNDLVSKPHLEAETGELSLKTSSATNNKE